MSKYSSTDRFKQDNVIQDQYKEQKHDNQAGQGPVNPGPGQTGQRLDNLGPEQQDNNKAKTVKKLSKNATYED